MEKLDKQKEQIIRDLLYEEGISNPRLYELLGVNNMIKVLKDTMEHIQATEFMLMKVEEKQTGRAIPKKNTREDTEKKKTRKYYQNVFFFYNKWSSRRTRYIDR